MERVRHANRTITTNYTEKALFFFITPRLIDPRAIRCSSAEDFPLRRKSVPFQRATRTVTTGGTNVGAAMLAKTSLLS